MHAYFLRSRIFGLAVQFNILFFSYISSEPSLIRSIIQSNDGTPSNDAPILSVGLKLR